MEVLLEQGLGDAEHLPGEDDHGGGAIAHLLVLGGKDMYCMRMCIYIYIYIEREREI